MKSQFSTAVIKLVPFVFLGLITASCGESGRTEARAKENIAKYSQPQKDFYLSFSPILIAGDILNLCVKAGAVNSDLLKKLNTNKDTLINKMREEDPSKADIVLDAEVISRVTIEAKSQQLTERDCNQAVNYLTSLGLLSD